MVAVSRAAQDYVRAWSGLESELIHPDVYANVPVRRPDPTFQRYVTMVNPCAYKGIVIFLALADALPDVPFLAVRSWGTTEDDLDALRRRPNITVCDPVDDMDTVFGRTRVVLMPSLWDETFGYTAVEAMLRGIPVLAADVGGLREAALGVQPPLPVRPITAYEKGGSAMPQPLVPAQDVTMWLERLTRLLSDDALRAEAGLTARRAARAFVGSIDPSLLERYLLGLSVDDACGVPR
jgi:glycosyltransferase involved in cell wall biosynthesis